MSSVRVGNFTIHLPETVRLEKIQEAIEDFNARFSSASITADLADGEGGKPVLTGIKVLLPGQAEGK